MRWSYLRLAVLLAIVVGAIGALMQTAVLAGGPTPIVRVSPAAQTVAAGTQVEVDLVIEGAPTFAAYEFHLAFDPALLTFVSITGGGDILENAGRDPFCLGPDAQDLKNAIISYACASTGGSGGPFGTGVLATLTFDAMCAGTSELAFVPAGEDLSVDPVSISSVLGASIVANGIAGEVTVNGVPCSGPGTLPGDANCNGSVNAIDAALILQINAGLLGALSCDANADVNDNGAIDSIDAALILQYAAGLLSSL